MSKFVVTAKLGDDYYSSTVVEQCNVFTAITDAVYALGCTYDDIISIVRVV